MVLDDFLDAKFAEEVVASYPTFGEAEKVGKAFSAVNEARKVQVTKYELFPDAVKRLADALKSPVTEDDLVATREEDAEARV